MGTIQPRARGGSSLGETLKANRKDREQIRRQRVTQAKPKVASAGGVTGVTRLTAGSLAQSNSAFPVGSAVTFADYSIAPLFGEAVSVSEDIDGRVTFGEAGFYECRAHVRLGWSSSATVSEARVSADFDGSDPYPLRFVLLPSADNHGGGGPSLREVFSWGPFYVDAGGWTFFGVNWQTAEPAFLSAMALDVWRVG